MKTALKKKKAIALSSISIFDQLEIENDKYLNDEELAYLLRKGLVGLSTNGLPNRTRSKLVKSAVCVALGYPVPKAFKKCQPRFLGQNFDTYVQKSLNLQIWNEEVSDVRRYVVIQVSSDDLIVSVRVINGQELAKLDTTGTLTQKYQAGLPKLESTPDVFSKKDTKELLKITPKKIPKIFVESPTDSPSNKSLLPLAEVAQRMERLIGAKFKALGRDQERNRGALLHALVCKALGYKEYGDNGKFPDVLNQLLEVKLQMSPTVDLGLVLPTSEEVFLTIGKFPIRHCDVRYAVFVAVQKGKEIKILNFAVGSGKDFFRRFKMFKGKVKNKKIQLRLPQDFFVG